MACDYYIACEKGHYTEHLLLDEHNPNQYLIDDRYMFHPMETIAWCFSCNRFLAVEELPPLDAIESALQYERINERFVSNDSALTDWLRQSVRDELKGQSLDRSTSLKIKFAWRSARQSLPRCLECRSTSLDFGTASPDGSQNFIHPDCGGKCEVNKRANWDDISYGLRDWYFSAEGESLQTFLERIWTPLREPNPPDSRLIALATKLQTAKTIGGFSMSRRGILGTEALFGLITSLPNEYSVHIWIPSQSDAQHYYDEAKAQHQNIEMLQVGDEAFFAPDVQEKSIALMRYQDMVVSIYNHKAKPIRAFPDLLPTIFTKDHVLNIFEDIFSMLTLISAGADL